LPLTSSGFFDNLRFLNGEKDSRILKAYAFQKPLSSKITELFLTKPKVILKKNLRFFEQREGFEHLRCEGS
jgi:hypothetical protein